MYRIQSLQETIPLEFGAHPENAKILRKPAPDRNNPCLGQLRVYMHSEINIKVVNKAPKDYFAGIAEQCNGGAVQYRAINEMYALKVNLLMNCLPETIFEMKLDDYEEFLKQRRISED